MKLITDKIKAINVMESTFKIDELFNVNFYDLVDTFGYPTFQEPSADEKVNYEWIFEFKGRYFSVYDWKTYSKDFTEKRLKRWSVGGIAGSNPAEFCQAIYDAIKWHEAVELENDFSNVEEFEESLGIEALYLFKEMLTKEDHTYMELQAFKDRAEVLGFTFNFGMDCVAYDFKASTNWMRRKK